MRLLKPKRKANTREYAGKTLYLHEHAREKEKGGGGVFYVSMFSRKESEDYLFGILVYRALLR